MGRRSEGQEGVEMTSSLTWEDAEYIRSICRLEIAADKMSRLDRSNGSAGLIVFVLLAAGVVIGFVIGRLL